MNKEAEGSILWLRCSVCSAEFPVFVFSGENDWTTAGLRTKTDIKKRIVYIYPHDDTPPSGMVAELVKVDRVKSTPGESFQDYRNRSAKSDDRYIYRCLNCQSNHAEGIENLDPVQLEEKGYELVNFA